MVKFLTIKGKVTFGQTFIAVCEGDKVIKVSRARARVFILSDRVNIASELRPVVMFLAGTKTARSTEWVHNGHGGVLRGDFADAQHDLSAFEDDEMWMEVYKTK